MLFTLEAYMLFKNTTFFLKWWDPVYAPSKCTTNSVMTTKSDDWESKREKLRGFENWPQWADQT